MRRTYKLYLEDILDSINNILQFVNDASYDEFIMNRMMLHAVTKNFEIIGVASNKIPTTIRDNYPMVDWRKIINFRNVLAHEYFGIDYEIMWDVIQNKLPELKEQMEMIVKNEA